MGVLSFVKFRFIDRRERSGGQASITKKKRKKKNIFVVAKTKKRVEKLFIGNIKLPGKITIILFGVFTEFFRGIYF